MTRFTVVPVATRILPLCTESKAQGGRATEGTKGSMRQTMPQLLGVVTLLASIGTVATQPRLHLNRSMQSKEPRSKTGHLRQSLTEDLGGVNRTGLPSRYRENVAHLSAPACALLADRSEGAAGCAATSIFQ